MQVKLIKHENHEVKRHTLESSMCKTTKLLNVQTFWIHLTCLRNVTFIHQ